MPPYSALDRVSRTFLSRPTQFMLLALMLSSANTYASTLGASLFLARAGADSLPYYYMFFATLSVPLSLFFSTIIDRWPRAHTLKAMLAGFTVISCILALLADTGEIGLYALYLGISICELLIFSVYYVLLADYFTATEAKRYNGTVAICMAGGGLIGGGIVGLAMTFLSPQAALLIVPVLVAATLAHLMWLSHRERPLDETESASDENLIQSIKMQSRLIARFPIVALLAGAVFLNVLLQCFSEYLTFSIYTEHFTNEADLATFLGLINALLNILGVVVVFVFTNPMITKLGVARFNLVFPALNLAALATVVFDQRLPSAILAHIAYDPLEHSIDIPVFTMNYNAVPHRFVGRVRVVNDGIAYPLALATAGIMLLTLSTWLDLAEMAFLGVILCLGFVLVHWGIGRNYLRGLIEMLRSGAVDLDHAGEGFRLPAHYREDVRQMLASADPDIVGIGLEIAARSHFALAPGELERALAMVSPATGLAVLGRIAKSTDPETHKTLSRLASSADAHIRATAIEVLTIEGYKTEADEIRRRRSDPDGHVRALAAAELWLQTGTEAAAQDLSSAADADPGGALSVCRVLAARAGSLAMVVLDHLAGHADPAVAEAALATMGTLAGRGAQLHIPVIDPFSRSPDAAVRSAAFRLLARFSPSADLSDIATRGLADPMPNVRHSTAVTLGARGEDAVAALTMALAGNPEQRDAAIEGLGLAGGRRADDILFTFVEPRVLDRIAGNMAMARRLPTDRPGWTALAAAIVDANEQAVDLVLQCLGALGYRRTLKCVRTMLTKGDARKRSHAVETLASLAHRRYVLPLMPLLEKSPRAMASVVDEAGRRELLGTALGSTDVYIQAGAVIAWYAEFGHVPPQIARLAHPLVARTAQELSARKLAASTRGAPIDYEDITMNRLVFLKSIPMFSEMTLENLIAIDSAMTRETYLSREEVVVEGDVGDKLYIIYRGTVAVRKAGHETELARLGSGQVFGEMSLFDDEPRSASVAAIEETEVLSLGRDQFHSLAHQRPQIVMEICKVLVGRLRSANS